MLFNKGKSVLQVLRQLGTIGNFLINENERVYLAA